MSSAAVVSENLQFQANLDPAIRGAYLNGSMIDVGGGVAVMAASLPMPARGTVTA